MSSHCRRNTKDRRWPCGGRIALAGLADEGFEVWVCLRCYAVSGRHVAAPVVLFDRNEGPDP